MRAELNEDALTEYVALWQAGETAPPVVAFYDGAAYWLADGFHRAESAARAGIESIPCDVRAGTRRDAILYAVGANARHGLRRTNADKRRAVETLLADPEWAAWSNREIARRACVNPSTVDNMRNELAPVAVQRICRNSADAATPTRTVERNGTTYQQNTANIGRRAEPATAAIPPGVRMEPKRVEVKEADVKEADTSGFDGDARELRRLLSEARTVAARLVERGAGLRGVVRGGRLSDVRRLIAEALTSLAEAKV